MHKNPVGKEGIQEQIQHISSCTINLILVRWMNTPICLKTTVYFVSRFIPLQTIYHKYIHYNNERSTN